MFYGEVLYVTVAPLAIVGVVVLAILALSGRSEPDARGERAYVLYLALVSFVALFTLLFALVELSSTAAETLLEPDPGELVEPFGQPDLGPSFDDELRTREAINTAAIVAVAAGVLIFHRRKTQRLLDDERFAASAAARTLTAYLYAVSFAAMTILLVAASLAVPAAVRAIAPGMTAVESSAAERDAAITDLAPALVAAAGAVVIHVTHWREAARIRRGAEG